MAERISYKTLLERMQPDPNEVMLIKGLFSHAGWVRYEEMLVMQIAFLTGQIDDIIDGKPITNATLEYLKTLTAMRRVYNDMLQFKEGLLDSVKNPLVIEEPEEQKEHFTPPIPGA